MSAIDRPSVIGVLGLGAMGAGVAGDLKSSGLDVVSTAAGRSGRSRERAERAGVRLLESLDAVVAAADTFLSIVPADQAEPLAQAVAAALRGKRLHFVDCNSITPSKAARIAATVQAAGATVSDGGIIGPPPGGKVKTRLYVSGPHADVLASLSSERMPVIRLGDSLTQATEMKVLFSAANKGTAALLANIMAAAAKAGLLDRVMGELDDVRPGLLTALRSSAPDLDDKAARWAIEMDDIAEGLADLGAHDGYHRAAGDGYRRLAANLPDTPGATALERVLAAWVGRKHE
ncbi:MAG: NAD(P)-binding domain-containing protein [Hyphomicrobiaceae bacterium]|nr:NAD(P)-binding domain-containing protein [Hyphomicrobiaceae bacterium]